ncbi:hypothetical protein LUZ61_016900 [Rhynchospora tenuis]|uniref:NB-ARC domain-containing protein n=1 Tax=Rhynchospora tenuis TaxID=198213 RepID=A0AAD6EKG6_9POAL|nr:hypothetical protein LUZ61_016900 [Rhynchospora tenuis]
MLYSGTVEAAAATAVGIAVSSITSTIQMQQSIDVTLYSIQPELMKFQCAIIEARGRRITNQMLLKWWAEIIEESYRGNYYHRTFKHHHSLPSMIESESTNSPTNRATKRRRTIRTWILGDEELQNLHNVLERLKNIDIRAFLKMVYAQPERPMKTYLYMDQYYRLLNLDKEKQQVMNFLFEPCKPGESNVAILPIVGPGAAGKTSLTIHCFEDTKVKNHFSLRIYIGEANISDANNGLPIIYKKILEQCNGACTTNYDDNTLLVMLKQYISSERYFLVLDHVWNVDYKGWNALWNCLSCGKQGSKVICMIRSTYFNKYKEIVNPRAVNPLIIDGFSEDEYMLFFNEHAFGGADPEDYPELAKIGKEIGKKMNGSIWGAMILGELLRDNLNAIFWSNFLKDGFLSPLSKCTDILAVVKTMTQLLPKGLELTFGRWDCPVKYESKVKTFRELMILGPKKEKNLGVQFEFLVTKHFILNWSSSFIAICGPSGDKSKIFYED